MSKKDYHIHTSASIDADYSVEEIMDRAYQQGVKSLAIADHNTVVNVKLAQQIGKQVGIDVISGIEIDCEFEGVSFHMLGFHIDVEDPYFTELNHYYHDQAVNNTWKAKDLFCEAMSVELSDEVLHRIAIQGVLVPEDIGAVIIADKRYQNETWLQPYLPQGSRSDNPNVNFFWDFFSQGKIAGVKSEQKKAKEIIDMIHKTGGIAVVAHPGANFKDKEEILIRLLESGVDGLEVYSSYHSQQQTQHYLEIAQKLNLLISCGSDFHGHHKPAIEIGRIPYLTNEEEIIRI